MPASAAPAFVLPNVRTVNQRARRPTSCSIQRIVLERPRDIRNSDSGRPQLPSIHRSPVSHDQNTIAATPPPPAAGL